MSGKKTPELKHIYKRKQKTMSKANKAISLCPI